MGLEKGPSTRGVGEGSLESMPQMEDASEKTMEKEPCNPSGFLSNVIGGQEGGKTRSIENPCLGTGTYGLARNVLSRLSSL